MKAGSSSKKPLLSISLLVSNRIDTIRACMESIQPLLEAVPSELIVVDTGSTDGSVDIAREYADEIVPFTWTKDFSAARNAGVERATGEWFLYLDDDEWFEDVSEIITFFLSGEYKEYECAWYIQRNYTDKEGTGYTDAYAGRMSRRVPGFHFEGKVHEQFVPVLGKVKTFSAYVHHYGYVYANKEEARKHSERNISLAEAELREKPGNIRMAAQLVQEYMAAERFEEAKGLAVKTIAEQKEQITHPFLQYLITCLPRIERLRKAWGAAEAAFKEVREKYPVKLLAELVCIVEEITVMEEKEDSEALLKLLPEYFVLSDRVRMMGNAIRQQEIMDFAAYESELTRQNMLTAGIRAMLQSKQYAMAKELFDRVDWTEEGNPPSALLLALLRIYAESGCGENFFPYCGEILNNPHLSEEMCNGIEDTIHRFPERREEMIRGLEKLHRKEPYLLLLHAEYCLKNESKEKAEDAMEAYFEGSKGKYDAKMAALYVTEPAYISRLLEKIDYDTFKEGVGICLKDRGAKAVAECLPELESAWNEKEIVFFKYLKTAVLEELLLQSMEPSFAQLFQYAEAVLAHAKDYFAKELLEEGKREALPKNCRFAFLICKAEQYKNVQNKEAWLECVKQAAEVYPVMAPVIEAWQALSNC